MDDDWGPWVEHDGRGCPCPGQRAHVVLGCYVEFGPCGIQVFDPSRDPGPWAGCTLQVLGPDEAIVVAEPDGSWSWSRDFYPVARYRVRRPATTRRLAEVAA